MRKLLLFFILFFAESSLKAQDSYNFSPYGIGFFASQIHPYDDLNIVKPTRSYSITGYYNITPYLPIGAEFQFGHITGGSIISDPSKRAYDNNYKAFILHGDIGIGELIDYSGNIFLDIVKDFYIGTGVGFISNNMAFIQRTNLVASSAYPVGTYTFPGENSSVNFMVPIRLGYEYKIYNSYDEPFIGINIGYVHNITWGEGLDGYKDPPNGFKNNSPDQYSQIIIGLKINFGSVLPYAKQIN